MDKTPTRRTPETEKPFDRETLAVQWFEFMHDVNAALMSIYQDAHNEGIDQKEIGKRLKMDAGQVSRYLHGRQNMTVRTIHNLARAMGYRPKLTFESLKTLPLSNRSNWTEWQTSEPRPASLSGGYDYVSIGERATNA